MNNRLTQPDAWDDDFAHYGVLGMKWGIRKRRQSSGKGKRSGKTSQTKKPSTTDSTEKTRYSSDYLKQQKLRTKKLNQMSNDEIRAYTQRIQLEQQYNMLNAQQKAATRTRGQKFVSYIGETAKGIGSDLFREYGKRAAVNLIEAQIRKRGIRMLAKKR